MIKSKWLLVIPRKAKGPKVDIMLYNESSQLRPSRQPRLCGSPSLSRHTDRGKVQIKVKIACQQPLDNSQCSNTLHGPTHFMETVSMSKTSTVRVGTAVAVRNSVGKIRGSNLNNI